MCGFLVRVPTSPCLLVKVDIVAVLGLVGGALHTASSRLELASVLQPLAWPRLVLDFGGRTVPGLSKKRGKE